MQIQKQFNIQNLLDNQKMKTVYEMKTEQIRETRLKFSQGSVAVW